MLQFDTSMSHLPCYSNWCLMEPNILVPCRVAGTCNNQVQTTVLVVVISSHCDISLFISSIIFIQTGSFVFLRKWPSRKVNISMFGQGNWFHFFCHPTHIYRRSGGQRYQFKGQLAYYEPFFTILFRIIDSDLYGWKPKLNAWRVLSHGGIYGYRWLFVLDGNTERSTTNRPGAVRCGGRPIPHRGSNQGPFYIFSLGFNARQTCCRSVNLTVETFRVAVGSPSLGKGHCFPFQSCYPPPSTQIPLTLAIFEWSPDK